MDDQTEYEKARAYLEQIQRQAYGRVGKMPPHMDMSPEAEMELQKKLAKEFYDKGYIRGQSLEQIENDSILQLKKARQACPTPFQEPWQYKLLMDLVHEIEGVLRENISTVPSSNYIFGSLPTGQVNAMALRVPGTSYVLILFEAGLFGFANLISKAVARVFPCHGTQGGQIRFGTSKEECESAIEANPDVVLHFLDVLLAYVAGGHPHKARRYLIEPEYTPVSESLLDSMEIFILAHEFGHLIGGHLSMETRKAESVGQIDGEQIVTNWQNELEADTTALKILISVRTKRGYDVSLSFWGADLFFGCIDVVEKAVQILAWGKLKDSNDQGSETHPPTSLRRQSLREVLKGKLPDQTSSAAIQLADQVSHIIEVFWRKCEPILYKAHNEGVKPSPSWGM